MSFNKISLPHFLIADLYKEGLVVMDNETGTIKKNNKKEKTEETANLTGVSEIEAKKPVKEVSGPINFLGNNQKRISIIVNDESAVHLQDELLGILSAILSACKLNLADVAIVNIHHQQVNDARLRSELSPAIVLLFGVPTTGISLPFSIPEYKVQLYNNCIYVQSLSLTNMKGSSNEARLEKSKLWMCLKNLFNV